jgi:hypothetical protein
MTAGFLITRLFYVFSLYFIYMSYINQWLRQEFNYCDAFTEKIIIPSVSLDSPILMRGEGGTKKRPNGERGLRSATSMRKNVEPAPPGV